jgi:hypothetical protein
MERKLFIILVAFFVVGFLQRPIKEFRKKKEEEESLQRLESLLKGERSEMNKNKRGDQYYLVPHTNHSFVPEGKAYKL